MNSRNAPNFAAGEKITEPGIYTGVSLETYHGDCCDGPSISSSGIRKIVLHSPADYFDTSPYNPDRAEEKPKEHFVLGRAVHHLVLGEPNFTKVFVARPEKVMGEPWHGTKTICKDWLKANVKGRLVLTPDQLDAIKGMSRSLAREPLVKAGILSGRIEQSFFVRDPATGIWLKWRPDAVPNESGDFADLKSASSVEDDDLERAVDDFGYYIQAGLGRRMCRELLGRDMQSFHFVFVQSKRPHSVSIQQCKPSDMDKGSQEVDVGLRIFKHCLDTGEWIGPAGTQNDARYLSRKPWNLEKADRRLKQLQQEIASWSKQPKPAGLA